MTGPYFDTGIALKLVIEEPLSPAVRRFVGRRQIAVPFSVLLEVEMENALQALRFRKSISTAQLAGARKLRDDLIGAGNFRRADVSLDRIASETLSLAPVITSATGCRTLDLMHVATAKLIGSSAFVSTDKRQLEAARRCGLKAIEIK